MGQQFMPLEYKYRESLFLRKWLFYSYLQKLIA